MRSTVERTGSYSPVAQFMFSGCSVASSYIVALGAVHEPDR